MPATSEARILANRKNSLRSTGPKTPEGKEQSRRNGLKHGLAGSGVVAAADDAPEVDRRAFELRAELDPRTALGRLMVAQLATLSVRMERSARHEQAALDRRVRHAVEDFDRRRIDMAEYYCDAIAEDPRGHLIELRRSPEGVDRLIEAWQALRTTLAGHCSRWTAAHQDRLAHLGGLRPEEAAGSRPEQLSRAVRDGHFRLPDPGWAGLDNDAKLAWARDRLFEWIDAKVAELKEHRETLDLEAIAADRREAPELALFDTSRESTLARRYESEARRGFFKALAELRRVEAEAEAAERCEASPEREPGPEIEPGPVAGPIPAEVPVALASSRAAGPATPGEPVPAADRAPFWPAHRFDGVARGLDGRVLAVGRAVVVPG